MQSIHINSHTRHLLNSYSTVQLQLLTGKHRIDSQLLFYYLFSVEQREIWPKLFRVPKLPSKLINKLIWLSWNKHSNCEKLFIFKKILLYIRCFVDFFSFFIHFVQSSFNFVEFLYFFKSSRLLFYQMRVEFIYFLENFPSEFLSEELEVSLKRLLVFCWF